MIQYIADEAHFQEVIARVANVKEHLWIGTADIKDLYVGERPLLGVPDFDNDSPNSLTRVRDPFN